MQKLLDQYAGKKRVGTAALANDAAKGGDAELLRK